MTLNVELNDTLLAAHRKRVADEELNRQASLAAHLAAAERANERLRKSPLYPLLDVDSDPALVKLRKRMGELEREEADEAAKASKAEAAAVAKRDQARAAFEAAELSYATGDAGRDAVEKARTTLAVAEAAIGPTRARLADVQRAIVQLADLIRESVDKVRQDRITKLRQRRSELVAELDGLLTKAEPVNEQIMEADSFIQRLGGQLESSGFSGIRRPDGFSPLDQWRRDRGLTR